jgi:hypothetical protein
MAEEYKRAAKKQKFETRNPKQTGKSREIKEHTAANGTQRTKTT